MPTIIRVQLSTLLFLRSSTTPDDYVGGVVSDISKRKGIVSEMNDRGNVKYILAKVPISKMFGYMTDLRTITSGRGDFNMLFSHYEKA